MAKRKFFMFIDGADDAAMYAVDTLQSITCAADGALVVTFSPGKLGDGQAASVDTVALTITADTEKAVMTSIAEATGGTRQRDSSVIVVADDVNGVYINSNITACAITLDA